MTKTEIADALDGIKQIAESLDAAINKLAIAVEKDEQAEKPGELPPLFDESLSNEALQPKAEKPNAIITLEVLRAALTDLTTAKGAADTKQLLAEYGAKKLSDVPADKYASLMVDAKAWAGE